MGGGVNFCLLPELNHPSLLREIHDLDQVYTVHLTLGSCGHPLLGGMSCQKKKIQVSYYHEHNIAALANPELTT